MGRGAVCEHPIPGAEVPPGVALAHQVRPERGGGAPGSGGEGRKQAARVNGRLGRGGGAGSERGEGHGAFSQRADKAALMRGGGGIAGERRDADAAHPGRVGEADIESHQPTIIDGANR